MWLFSFIYVDDVILKEDDDEEMKILDDINSKIEELRYLWYIISVPKGKCAFDLLKETDMMGCRLAELSSNRV